MKPSLKTLLERGVEEIISKDSLETALKKKKKLRVKYGIDPTAPDLHLGHAVLLRKLRQFQDLGHKAVLIVGDFTAQIGDPSHRSKARPLLSPQEVKKNLKSYLQQAGKILDIKKAEIYYNSRWFKDVKTFLKLLSFASIQQMLHRADFKKRIKAGHDVSLLEAAYPLLQGYDSVMVKADVEIGGTDQKFNLLMGRQLQKRYGQKEQDILMVPLLEGTDGERKMSKSYGNYISLKDDPQAMFGKLMSIPDKLMPKYFELLTDIDFPKKSNPKTAKLLLAKTIVSQIHGIEKATWAMAEFVNVFSKKEPPSDMPVLRLPAGKAKLGIELLDLLLKAGVKSKSEARRLVSQKGVKINGKVQDDIHLKIKIKEDIILQIGKRTFFRVRV